MEGRRKGGGGRGGPEGCCSPFPLHTQSSPAQFYFYYCRPSPRSFGLSVTSPPPLEIGCNRAFAFSNPISYHVDDASSAPRSKQASVCTAQWAGAKERGDCPVMRCCCSISPPFSDEDLKPPPSITTTTLLPSFPSSSSPFLLPSSIDLDTKASPPLRSTQASFFNSSPLASSPLEATLSLSGNVQVESARAKLELSA